MPPKFRTRSVSAPIADSPERLFDDLSRGRGSADALWAHQADVLRTYHQQHLTTPDVALELPTGAGKTLPGLLITEWRRRALRQRVLYACPTQQLARQTTEAAGRLGIETVTLVGPHRLWSTADKISYESAKAVGVTTYSTMFNARPALEPAQTLLFDDAHAAEGYVAGSFSIDVNRFADKALFMQVLELLRPALSGVAFEALVDDNEVGHRTPHLVSVAFVRQLAPALAGIFSALGKDADQYWKLAALQDRLDRCLVYVAWDAILIRPVVPPTGSQQQFSAPEQRLYLSATLGEGGELERAFGRSPITRLAVPDGWDSRGAGRRFFVFPDLMVGVDARGYASRVVAEAGKALVLAPSTKRAEAAKDLAPADAPVLGPAGKLDDLLSTFRGLQRALLTLAGRYDGLDLPRTQCQVTVLDGMPTGEHLQERFLSDTLVAGRVLRERRRTRVVQGAGRCTRGLSDYSVVVVLGDALSRFLTLPEVFNALRPEMQAEVDFGRDNSTIGADEGLEFIQSFLAQDAAWFDQAEPALLEARRAATRTSPPDTAELASAAAHEVKATAALWSGDWGGASREALEAAKAVISPQLAGYRAFWTYLASAWLEEEAGERDDASLRKASLDLLRKAYVAGRGTAWLRQVQPLPVGEVVLDPADQAAVAAAVASGTRQLNGAKWAAMHTGMLAALAQDEAVQYEGALTALGKLLGAESYKPKGEGRTDSAWVWPASWWLALEAKTEEKPEHPVSQKTIRQANGQLKTIAHARDTEIPEGSAVAIISPRQLVEPTAVIEAEPFLYLLAPDVLLDLAQDATKAWMTIRAQAGGMAQAEAIALASRVFDEYGLLPSGLRARLLSAPIQG